MASALSDDEFHRMQLQLIELRTEKYELDSKTKKQEREIQTLREAAENSDRELQKAQKVINKSKKTKEVELLVQENDSLQRKLQSQEDEFRMQNQTLMQELTMLVSTNEELEKKLASKDSDSNTQTSAEYSHLEDELRRLQAQNAALQKTVSGLQSKASTPEGESVGSESGDVPSADTQQPAEHLDAATLQHTVDELKLNLDTEAEEKKILKLELAEREEKHSKELKTLNEEIEKLNEKFKRKQESYMQLQEEKEQSFKDSSVKLEELQASKDRDQKYYTDQITRLQQEIAKYQRIQEEIKSNSDVTVKQLQNKMAQMQQQIDAADIVESQHMQEKSSQYEAHLQDLRAKVLQLTQARDDLNAQLQESKKSSEDARQELSSVRADKDKHIQVAQDATKLAEKRKGNLDELAIQYQRDCDKHREQMLAMENDYDAKLNSIQQKLEQEQKKTSELSSELERLKPVLEERQTKITSLEEKTSWLERRLADTEGSLDKTLDEKEVAMATMQTEHEDAITALKTSHSTDIEQLTNTFQSEIDSLKGSEESQKDMIKKLEEENQRFKQDIKDGQNDKKVHEKKGQSVLKDLKKQLHSERKRADKLQERLQEVLSSGSHNKSLEDLLHSDRNEHWREDQSSVSSWSGVGTLASYSTNHSALSTSPISSPMSPSTEFPAPPEGVSLLDSENKELLGRLATIQQEKWDLEEKVRHLETSTAAMANDLIEKAKIISHYVMESKTDTKHSVAPVDDKITLKKVLDLVNKSEDQGLREMNKKLQNMLEETLTKNMHLQKDLETMSQELVRLSKIPHQPPDTGGGAGLSATGTARVPNPPTSAEQSSSATSRERTLTDSNSSANLANGAVS